MQPQLFSIILLLFCLLACRCGDEGTTNTSGDGEWEERTEERTDVAETEETNVEPDPTEPDALEETESLTEGEDVAQELEGLTGGISCPAERVLIGSPFADACYRLDVPIISESASPITLRWAEMDPQGDSCLRLDTGPSFFPLEIPGEAIVFLPILSECGGGMYETELRVHHSGKGPDLTLPIRTQFECPGQIAMGPTTQTDFGEIDLGEVAVGAEVTREIEITAHGPETIGGFVSGLRLIDPPCEANPPSKPFELISDPINLPAFILVGMGGQTFSVRFAPTEPTPVEGLAVMVCAEINCTDDEHPNPTSSWIQGDLCVKIVGRAVSP